MSMTVKRIILGVLSIALLIASLILLIAFEGNQSYMAGSICLRVGLVLGALWLALPQAILIAKKLSPRLTVAVLIAALIVVIRPKAFPIAALLVLAVAVLEFAGWILKPIANKPRPKQPE